MDEKISKYDAVLYRIWKAIRSPFILPESICNHSDQWEIFEMHMAGCRMCGKVHTCVHGMCPCLLNVEEQSICTITGLCTQMLRFSTMEYIDNVCDPYTTVLDKRNVDKRKRSGSTRHSRKHIFKSIVHMHTRNRFNQHVGVDACEKLDDVVHSTVMHILCSSQWTESRNVEHARYVSKGSTSLSKVLRGFKKSCPNTLPIVPDILSQTIEIMRGFRAPSCHSLEERQKLGKWCVDTIRHHLLMLQANFPGIVAPHRINGMVVGLLYLMRYGIVVKSIVVLPILNLLCEVLPMENHLGIFFNVKGKIITETENVVKMALKTLSTNELMVYGTPQSMNQLINI